MHRPGTTGRNIFTGVLKLLKRGRSTGALEVPAQDSGCMVGSPDTRIEVSVGSKKGGKIM